jgi:predicted outer membrane repeat protein
MSIRFPVFVSVLAVLSSSAAAGTWYVKRNAGPGGDGLSWGTAYQRVQDALAVANSGDQIWVAKSTYRPGEFSSPRTVTFQVPAGVGVYGGFLGGETSLSQRDWAANETILSGDLHLDDQPGFVNRTDNCYHVVTIVGAGPTAALDGFTIRGGNADGSGATGMGGGLYAASTSSGGPALAHLRFADNRAAGSGGAVGATGQLSFADSLFEGNHALSGGGVYTDHSISLVRCVLRSNDAAMFGGACYFDIAGTANLPNCVITGNTAWYVGGVYGLYTDVYLRNCALAMNHATSFGGGAVDGFGYLVLYDSIVWGNTDTTHPGLFDQQVDYHGIFPSYSAIQGDSPPWNQDPRWVDPLGPDGIAGTADDDLRLSCLSPYIDAGANSLVGGGSIDLSGNPRFVDDPAVPDTGTGGAPIVDFGPYEFACGCSDVQSYCSALPNSTGASAAIGWSGSTSLFANSFTLLASGAPPLKSGLFFYGATQVNLPWGDGIRCVGGSLQRLAVLQTDASGSASFPLDFTLPPASSGPHAILPGSSWNFQFLFRDPAGGPAGWNTTDALAASFCP